MLGMVSRLTSAKGLDLFPAFKENILDSGKVQFVLLADPENPQYAKMIRQWEQDRVKVFFGFEEKLARRIYAGCDIFLMPSKEELSGIQQFIVMHYGAVPVVHQTGVLRDSVKQYQPGIELRGHDDQSMGVGFTFAEFAPESFCDAVRAALDL